MNGFQVVIYREQNDKQEVAHFSGIIIVYLFLE